MFCDVFCGQQWGFLQCEELPCVARGAGMTLTDGIWPQNAGSSKSKNISPTSVGLKKENNKRLKWSFLGGLMGTGITGLQLTWKWAGVSLLTSELRMSVIGPGIRVSPLFLSPKPQQPEWQECGTEEQTVSTFRIAGWPYVIPRLLADICAEVIVISWSSHHLLFNPASLSSLSLFPTVFVPRQRVFGLMYPGSAFHSGGGIHCYPEPQHLPAWVLSLTPGSTSAVSSPTQPRLYQADTLTITSAFITVSSTQRTIDLSGHVRYNRCSETETWMSCGFVCLIVCVCVCFLGPDGTSWINSVWIISGGVKRSRARICHLN